MDPTVIGYGTLSEPKLTAARAAVQRIALPITIRGVSTRTGEREQPRGAFGDAGPLSEGMAGALTRATEAGAAVTDATWGLGAENQLLEIDMATDLDLTVVCLLRVGADPSSAIYTTSEGIPCPRKFVRGSLRSGRHVTAGKLYATDHAGVDHANWHRHATGGRTGRDEFMEHAIFAALCLAFPPSMDEG